MVTEATRISSYALLTHEDRMLLCRISSELPRWAGYWTLPGGGLDFGEKPEDAVVREVGEETGLLAQVIGLAAVDSEVLEAPDKRTHVFRVLYHATVVGGELRNEANGSTDLAQWFTLEEAADLPLVEVARLGLQLAFGKIG